MDRSSGKAHIPRAVAASARTRGMAALAPRGIRSAVRHGDTIESHHPTAREKEDISHASERFDLDLEEVQCGGSAQR